ncbi:MAG: glutamyl-tRNA amidotransferase [Bacilli bacterium]
MKKVINLKTKLFYSEILGLMYASIPKVYAETDPLNAINNLSNFIFDMLTGVGTMILAFGALQFGLAIKSQDPSQRANGILTMVGGIIIVGTRVLLNKIIG